MAALGKILFFVGIGLLGAGVKWGIGWALLGGFVALLLLCTLPLFSLLFGSRR